MNAEQLLTHFDRLADAPDAIPRLRRFILDLAVRGKLVEQDLEDEPAAELLKRIATEKKKYQANGPPKKSLPSVSENEKTFPIPKSWEWVRLGDVSTSLLGKTLNKAKNKGTYKPYLRSVNVYWFKLSLSDIKEMKFEEQELEKYALCKGDVLVCEGGEAGRASVWNDEMEGIYYQNALHRIRFFGSIEPNYFIFALNSDSNNGRLANYCTGVTIKHLTTKRLVKYCFPIPPLAEQHRIVAKVDELMALCDRMETSRKEQEATRDRLTAASLARLNAPDPDPAVFQNHTAFVLNNLTSFTTRPDQIKALRQTILNLAVRGKLVEQDPEDEPAGELLRRIAAEQVALEKSGSIKKTKPLPPVSTADAPFDLPVGWTWARFPEIGTFGRGKSKHRPRNDPVLYEDGTYPFIQTGDVARSGGSIETYSSLYNDVGLAQSAMWPAGTLCITIAANIADSGILTFDACFPDSVVGLIVHDNFEDARFFEYFLRTAKNDLHEFAPSTAQKNINLGILMEVLIPLPPLAEQRRIVAKVDELMAVCDRLEASLATGEETRGRLMEAVLWEALEVTA